MRVQASKIAMAAINIESDVVLVEKRPLGVELRAALGVLKHSDLPQRLIRLLVACPAAN
jgi:predicted glycosyltransferase